MRRFPGRLIYSRLADRPRVSAASIILDRDCNRRVDVRIGEIPGAEIKTEREREGETRRRPVRGKRALDAVDSRSRGKWKKTLIADRRARRSRLARTRIAAAAARKLRGVT